MAFLAGGAGQAAGVNRGTGQGFQGGWLLHAPEGVVVADEVVGAVPEDHLAEVAHDLQVLALVVHTPGGQAQ